MDQKSANIVELDVRPHLRKKLEPFQLIMDTVKTLEENSIFILHATFKPTPLLGVLKMKGLVGKSEQKDKDHWITTFVNKKNKSWLEEQTSEAEDSTGSPHLVWNDWLVRTAHYRIQLQNAADVLFGASLSD